MIHAKLQDFKIYMSILLYPTEEATEEQETTEEKAEEEDIE